MLLRLQAASHMTCTPAAGMDYHQFGTNKNRKPVSTGGGRAWSKNEEAYLLQMRLQKMPYKHIAAHLRKTELACRLHYHQLSSAGHRRKRTTSVSSGSSTGGCSPDLPAIIPPLLNAHDQHSHTRTPSPSPPGSSGSRGHLYHDTYAPSHAQSYSHAITRQSSHNYLLGYSNNIRLPRISTDISVTSSCGATSHRLPTILHRSISMPLVHGGSDSTCVPRSASHARESYAELPQDVPEYLSSTDTTITPTNATVPQSASTTCGAILPSLCLGYASISPPPLSAGPYHPVDMARLHSVYASHRASFWAAIACEYGQGSDPAVLEQAWQMGGMTTLHGLLPINASNDTMPELSTIPASKTRISSVKDSQLSSGTSASTATDKTRISSILGIDANPRDPEEREMVRRLEERRFLVTSVVC